MHVVTSHSINFVSSTVVPISSDPSSVSCINTNSNICSLAKRPRFHHQTVTINSDSTSKNNFQSTFISSTKQETLTAAATTVQRKQLDTTKMVRYVGKIVVPHARERVFELMSDWRNLQIWDMNITKSDLSSGYADPKNGVGTRYDCEFKIGDRQPIGVAYECINYSAPSKCEYRGLATLFKSTDTIQCNPINDDKNQTEVTAEFNLDFRGLLSPFSFVMGGSMKSQGPVIMKDMENFINSKLSSDD